MAKPLRSDLQELIDAGILNTETAGKIEAWYQHKQASTPNKFTTILSIFGSLLVSLGIVLLIAHNWDELSRLLKTILAFFPLLLGQAVCIYTLLRKKGNLLWAECSAVFLFFAIASSIALISQIYHVSGSLPSFLLTWLLLAFPLIYIMPSSVVSLLYIAVSTWYGFEVGYSWYYPSYPETPYFYIILMALAAPHFYLLWKNKRAGILFHFHNWIVALSIAIMLGAFIDKAYPYSEWGFIAYLSLFTIYYRIGTSASYPASKFITNPFLSMGIIGVITILLTWSFNWPWSELVYNKSRNQHFWGWIFSFIAIALLAVNFLLTVVLHKKRAWANISPVEYSPFVLAFLVLLVPNLPGINQLIINAWILLIGLHFVRGGSKEDHLGILNFGLLIIFVLAVIRFFDDSIPFVWRGLFFLLTGAGFFIANYWMLKKRKLSSVKNIPS